VVGTTVHIAAVGALAIGLLVQLKGGIGADVLDVLVALCLAKTPGVIGVGSPWSGGSRITSHGQVLLIPILFVLKVG